MHGRKARSSIAQEDEQIHARAFRILRAPRQQRSQMDNMVCIHVFVSGGEAGARQFDVVKQLLAPSEKSTVHRRKASAKAGGGWLSCTSELVNVRPADTVRWRGKNLRDSSAAVVGHKIDLVGVRPPTSV